MSHAPPMLAAEIHNRIDELAPLALLVGSGDADVAVMEQHASMGCSLCARALVNAGARSASVSGPVSGKDAPVVDPCGGVALLHTTGSDEADRTREVEELAAYLPTERHQGEGDPTARVLTQVERILGFPLHFVSIVRGERVGYRVQRGLPSDVAGASGGVRREMTLCTHCVSSGRPLVIRNTAAEPFFRGSPLVRRNRIRAYVGVPLRTSKNILVGTLCALDYRPRLIPPEHVRVLELFARRVVAEIERPRSSAALEALLLDLPSPGREVEVYKRGWFEELLAIELTRASSEGRASALVAISGGSLADLAALAGKDEIVGEIDESTLGILLSGAGAEQANARCAALTSLSMPTSIDARSSVANGATRTPAEWIDAARAI